MKREDQTAKEERTPMTQGDQTLLRLLPVQGRWCLHSYYTVCPYAPDGSGRLLAAGVDPAHGAGEVLVLSREGEVLDRFGRQPVEKTAFYHTGFWQTWSPDARYVYYQAGTWDAPRVVRRELATGHEQSMEGDAEGAPPNGEPLISGLLGMLYAAGYGSGLFRPELSPVLFGDRERHGLFRYSFGPERSELALSVEEILRRHPQRDRLLASEQELKRRLGEDESLTLMAYCVRWNPQGDRLLFYFGNHHVVPSRGEPRLGYVFTSDRELRELHLAVDLSYGRWGVHWSWHPDGEHLIGYGPEHDDGSGHCLAMVKYDGTGYRKISSHQSGGHPSVCPADFNLVVTDTYGDTGELTFIDIRTDTVLKQISLPRKYGERPARGKNPYWVDLHPVFSPDGRYVLVNCFQENGLSALAELDVREALG